MRIGVKIWIFLFLLAGCDNDFVITPGSKNNNLVTGIYITTVIDPFPIDVWGNPQYPKTNSSHGFGIDEPYPNPFNGMFYSHFQLDSTAEISAWIETAYWESPLTLSNQENYLNNQVVKYDIVQINRIENRGTMIIDFSAENVGELVSPGFYRLYVKVNGFLTWRDVYFFDENGISLPDF